MLSIAEELMRIPKPVSPQHAKAERVKELRARGYTYREIAKEMGMAHATICLILNAGNSQRGGIE